MMRFYHLIPEVLICIIQFHHILGCHSTRRLPVVTMLRVCRLIQINIIGFNYVKLINKVHLPIIFNGFDYLKRRFS